jgi:hypothetical protein
MTSMVHHAASPTARRSVQRLDARVVRPSALVALILTVMLLLITVAVLLVAASTNTGVRVPHPIPLPALSAPSSAAR